MRISDWSSDVCSSDIALNKDKEFKSLGEFMEAVRANPGKHSASVVTGSAGELTAYLLMEAANLPQDAMNVVTYEGGGAARAAVAGEIGRAAWRERVGQYV